MIAPRTLSTSIPATRGLARREANRGDSPRDLAKVTVVAERRQGGSDGGVVPALGQVGGEDAPLDELERVGGDDDRQAGEAVQAAELAVQGGTGSQCRSRRSMRKPAGLGDQGLPSTRRWVGVEPIAQGRTSIVTGVAARVGAMVVSSMWLDATGAAVVGATEGVGEGVVNA